MKYRSLIIGAFLILFSFSGLAQSKTVTEFSKTAKGYNLYLYQSMIRMLNKDKNPEFNLLIRDLDHLKWVTTDSTGTQAVSVFKKLDAGLRDEGFEEIVTYDSKDSKCHIYDLEGNGNKSTWVITMLFEGVAGAVEMKGSVDMKYMSAMSSLNINKISDLLKIDHFD
jgi:hypothetical protein